MKKKHFNNRKQVKRKVGWIVVRLSFFSVLFFFLCRAYFNITKVEDIVVSCDISNIDYSQSPVTIRKLPISFNVANTGGDSICTERMALLYKAEKPLMPHIRIYAEDLADSLLSGGDVVGLIKDSRCSLDFDECDFSKEYLSEFDMEHIKNIQRITHIKYRVSTPRWKLNELQSAKYLTKSNPIDYNLISSSIMLYPDSNFGFLDAALATAGISKDSMYQLISEISVNDTIPCFCCSGFDGNNQVVDCYIEENHSMSYLVRDAYLPVFSPKRHFFSRCDISKCNLKIGISHIWNVNLDTVSFSFNTATNLVSATFPPDSIRYDGFDYFSPNKVRALEKGDCQFFIEFPEYKNSQEARVFVISASLPLVFTLCLRYLWHLLSLLFNHHGVNEEKEESSINRSRHRRKKRKKYRKQHLVKESGKKALESPTSVNNNLLPSKTDNPLVEDK
ncbi:MAG: hypothetical protein K6D59_04715 [Bacteroidales bacterium]|nr:hypothetical protein [Bacteroidales bacterium]